MRPGRSTLEEHAGRWACAVRDSPFQAVSKTTLAPFPHTLHWPHIAMLWSCEVVSLIAFFAKQCSFWCSRLMFWKIGQVMFYSLNRFTFVGTCIISFYECARCEVRLFLGRKGIFLRLIQSVHFCMEELKLAEDGRQWWEWRCLDGELSHEGSLQTGWYPQGNISNQY